MRGRLSETGFEESFEELCEKFPTAEEYLRHLYKDRRRWAAAFSVLTFRVLSFTSSRVEGVPLCVQRVSACLCFVLFLTGSNTVTCPLLLITRVPTTLSRARRRTAPKRGIATCGDAPTPHLLFH